jgi:hypothetical protein
VLPVGQHANGQDGYHDKSGEDQGAQFHRHTG